MTGTGEMALRGAAAAIVALATIVVADTSFAASRTCRQLQAELASVGSGSGGSAQFKKYDRAVGEQRNQLAAARSRARASGCGMGFLSPAQCDPLNDQIARMQSNLASLERKRDQLGGGAKPQRSRRQILAALDANDCNGKTVAERKAQADGDKGFLARLFGAPIRRGGSADGVERLGASAENGPSSVTRILNPNGKTTVLGPRGQFSTMCVRTCDGYYFPMSPSSSSADFDRDQKNCESACPGTQMQLFYRPASAEEIDTMTSAANGQPYASLSTAYLYRNGSSARPLSCGCQGTEANAGFSVIGGETARDDAPGEAVVPVPGARPDPALDPETLANAEGGLDVQTIRRLLRPRPATASAATGERKVRVVGPVFLPDPEAAIDLRAPDRKQVQ